MSSRWPIYHCWYELRSLRSLVNICFRCFPNMYAKRLINFSHSWRLKKYIFIGHLAVVSEITLRVIIEKSSIHHIDRVSIGEKWCFLSGNRRADTYKTFPTRPYWKNSNRLSERIIGIMKIRLRAPSNLPIPLCCDSPILDFKGPSIGFPMMSRDTSNSYLIVVVFLFRTNLVPIIKTFFRYPVSDIYFKFEYRHVS